MAFHDRRPQPCGESGEGEGVGFQAQFTVVDAQDDEVPSWLTGCPDDHVV
jgi:hypothetical protein